MDKIRIGKFISECRKDKHITQEQLAELLDVTDKSVSKWENGNCLPDASLYEPLCNVLGISINELFAGQRIPAEAYRKVADDNLLRMLKYRLYRFSDQRITFAEFDNALTRVAELTAQLKAFKTKEEAVYFMMEETGFSFEECSGAVDFYICLFEKYEVSEDEQ